MKLGILSDTHNNHQTLQQALAVFSNEGIETLIHCGDMTSPQTAALMTGFTVIHVGGNMDGFPGGIRQALLDLDASNSSAAAYSGQIDGRWLAATHGHRWEVLNELIHNGRYAYVFHGHTHRRRDVVIGQTRVINPGALGGTYHEERSVCIVDLTTDEVRFVMIND